jgi:CheY-like chemotaxis protein
VALLDVQMPRMDGFATTAAIRQREKETGGHLPIIAMTAYAMSGDRERCLNAGMDAYIAKPLHARELQSLVEKLGSAAVVRPDETAALATPPHCFDFGPALARLEGDVELLREQMRFFIQDAPGLLTEIGAAVARHDGEALQLAAHRLRGLLSSFDAGDAVAAAQDLEAKGRDNEFAQTGELYDELKLQLGLLRRALETFLDKGQ